MSLYRLLPHIINCTLDLVFLFSFDKINDISILLDHKLKVNSHVALTVSNDRQRNLMTLISTRKLHSVSLVGPIPEYCSCVGSSQYSNIEDRIESYNADLCAGGLSPSPPLVGPKMNSITNKTSTEINKNNKNIKIQKNKNTKEPSLNLNNKSGISDPSVSALAVNANSGPCSSLQQEMVTMPACSSQKQETVPMTACAEEVVAGPSIQEQ